MAMREILFICDDLTRYVYCVGVRMRAYFVGNHIHSFVLWKYDAKLIATQTALLYKLNLSNFSSIACLLPTVAFFLLYCKPILTHCDSTWERLLTLPSDTRARHKVTSVGRNEATMIHKIHARLLVSIVVRFGHLAEICETLKREGLPPNEVRTSFCHCIPFDSIRDIQH
jgi:hypothetical protein